MKLEVFILGGQRNRSEEKEGMLERLGEMKERSERIEKGSRERIEIERKEKRDKWE